MAGKLFGALTIAVMIVMSCGMMYGHAIQTKPLPPSAAVTMPDPAELEWAAGLQAGETVTRPVTLTVPMTVSVTLFPAVEDDREARAHTIYRLATAGALGLVLVFLVGLVGISLVR